MLITSKSGQLKNPWIKSIFFNRKQNQTIQYEPVVRFFKKRVWLDFYLFVQIEANQPMLTSDNSSFGFTHGRHFSW